MFDFKIPSSIYAPYNGSAPINNPKNAFPIDQSNQKPEPLIKSAITFPTPAATAAGSGPNNPQQ